MEEQKEEIIIEELTEDNDTKEQPTEYVYKPTKKEKIFKILKIISLPFVILGIYILLSLIIGLILSPVLNKLEDNIKKPVIYIHNDLKPGEEQTVDIILKDNDNIGIKTIYPQPIKTDNIYKWTVTLKNGIDNLYIKDRQYPYLFWDTENLNTDMDIDEGFCIKNTDTETFLEEKLRILGLTDIEITDFITYWLPELQKNEYNLIKFIGMDETDSYNKAFPLTISNDYPIHRVIMVYKATDKYIDIDEQILSTFIKPNAYVLEWGGLQIR